jgi:tripartite-type tricarboxylate transporter receptor subunit TctC
LFVQLQGLPAEIKDELAAGVRKIIANPDLKKNLEAAGLIVNYLSDQDSIYKWIVDKERLNKEIRETGVWKSIQAHKK